MSAPGAATSTDGAKEWRGRLLLLAVASLASLVFLEVALRLLTPFPITGRSNKTAHPRLGYVIDGSVADIDEHGFRNRGVSLQDAEIVVVGDSHVYGINVGLDDNFPSALSRATGRPVYGLGIGGYGVYHYMVLLDELRGPRVEDVILGLYPANDLVEMCSITALPYWSDYAAAEGLQGAECDGEGELDLRSGWLGKYSALASAFLYLVLDRIKPDRSGEPAFHFPDGQRVAVAKAENHARATSLDDPEVRRTFENSLRILTRAHQQLEANGMRFGVLMIPSRDRVLHEWARQNGHPMPDGFEALVAREHALARAYLDFFVERGITHVDALPEVASALDAAVRDGEAFYPKFRDGHPAAVGYRAYATAALDLLERMHAP